MLNYLLLIIAILCAAISILLAQYFANDYVVITHDNPKQLLHILLSLLAFSVLGIAVLQALLTAIQERLLHQRREIRMLQVLPPLQTMEAFLFQIIMAGFLLLSIVLITSFFSFVDIFSAHLWRKTVLTGTAWIVFAALLVGRLGFGWRGKIAIRWTLLGFALLMLSYFGSRFLMDFFVT